MDVAAIFMVIFTWKGANHSDSTAASMSRRKQVSILTPVFKLNESDTRRRRKQVLIFTPGFKLNESDTRRYRKQSAVTMTADRSLSGFAFWSEERMTYG